MYEIDTIESVNICVCSFSEVGDSLSQWRAYCGGGVGFAVGFSTEKLCETASKSGFSLHQCIYDPDVQKDVIDELIDDLLSTDFNTKPGYVDPVKANTFVVLKTGGDFAERLAMLAPLIKDLSFSDEQEWRLISRPIGFPKLDHRPGRSMITPFFRLLIGSDKEWDWLAEVVVGPSPHLELSKASIKSLLFKEGVRKVNLVRTTTVPFRYW